jgi:hypothetical protein
VDKPKRETKRRELDACIGYCSLLWFLNILQRRRASIGSRTQEEEVVVVVVTTAD